MKKLITVLNFFFRAFSFSSTLSVYVGAFLQHIFYSFSFQRLVLPVSYHFHLFKARRGLALHGIPILKFIEQKKDTRKNMCKEQREALEFTVQKSWDERFSRPAI